MESNSGEETKKNSFLISKEESLLYGYTTYNIYNDLYIKKNRNQLRCSSGCSGNDSHGVTLNHTNRKPEGKRVILSRKAKMRRKP